MRGARRKCDTPKSQKSVTFVTFEIQTPTRVPQIHLCSELQKTLILLAYGGHLTHMSRNNESLSRKEAATRCYDVRKIRTPELFFLATWSQTFNATNGYNPFVCTTSKRIVVS